MPFSVFYNVELKIVEGMLTGLISNELLREYSTAANELAIQNNCSLFITDYRDSEFQFSILELFTLPTRHEIFVNGLENQLKTLKRAILVSADKDWKNASFFETVAVNRGQNVKVFTNKTQAIKWLLSREN